LTPIVFELIQLFLDYDLTLAEINPLARLEDGRFIVLDGHVDLEAEARGKHAALLTELGIGDEETRQARPPTAFEIAGRKVNEADHRGVAGNVVEFDGNLGPRDRRGRRLAHALRRRAQARRQARQLLRDRRQPVRSRRLRADQADPRQARRREDRRDDERVSNTRVDIVARA
jgi:hypothetical protein